MTGEAPPLCALCHRRGTPWTDPTGREWRLCLRHRRQWDIAAAEAVAEVAQAARLGP